jgi:hypothetical protein
MAGSAVLALASFVHDAWPSASVVNLTNKRVSDVCLSASDGVVFYINEIEPGQTKDVVLFSDEGDLAELSWYDGEDVRQTVGPMTGQYRRGEHLVIVVDNEGAGGVLRVSSFWDRVLSLEYCAPY